MSVTVCYQHADHPAVEQCEVCRRPVCGSCLWYADSGERLCPEHGASFATAGRPVHPPERYAAGIPASEAAARRAGGPAAPYQGNSLDVGALLAVAAGLSGIMACAGFYWLLPLGALGLGIVTWLKSHQALDPRRTRLLSLGAMAIGALVFVLYLALAAFCLLAAFLPALLEARRVP